MKLRYKIIVFSTLFMAVFVVLNYGIQYRIVYPNFLELEREAAVKDMERCVQSLDREIEHRNAFLYDWSAWDDMCKYVGEQYKEFEEANFTPETFKNYTLSLVMIIQPGGKLIWGKGYDPKTNDQAFGGLEDIANDQLMRNPQRTNFTEVDESFSGIYRAPKGPLLIASRPIITSNCEKPIRGSLIFGRLLNDELKDTSAEQTRVDVNIWPVESKEISRHELEIVNHFGRHNRHQVFEAMNDTLLVYSIYQDVDKNPILLLRANVPRDIAKRGAAAMHFALLSVLGAGLLLLLVILVTVRVVITGPLFRLTRQIIAIGKSGNLEHFRDEPRKDEIGILSAAFANMAKQLTAARKNLLEQTYYSGMADMASGILPNIRNTLSPMLVEIGLLLQELRQAPLEKIRLAKKELALDSTSPARRADLKKYTGMAEGKIQALLVHTGEKLAGLARRATQIEEIMCAHDQFKRREHTEEEWPLDSLLNESIEFIPDTARQDISIQVDPGVGNIGSVKIHRLSMLQVFSNLIRNAIESIHKSKRSPGAIRIFAGNGPPAGADMIHVCIQDNGEGISKENLRKIFERDYSTKGKEHSGIGLHWCANVVQAMKGNLYAESEGPGTGARINVLMPRTR
ncbi:MAG: CHASE4 domain-containing protein [bacterium]